MAGILNSKERIMDTLVTQLGREQAANGQLNVRFASFTDYHCFYRASGSNNCAEDHTDRVYFEAFSRDQDLIIPELDLGTTSKPFKTADFEMDGVTIAEGTLRVGNVDYVNIKSGSNFAPSVGKLLKQITDNFKDLKLITTKDTFSDTSGFSFNESTGSFIFKNDSFNTEVNENSTRFNDGASEVSVATTPSLFMDEKLNHLPNFKYLPPVNTTSATSQDPRPLGLYEKINNDAYTYEGLMDHLKENIREKKEFLFSDTSYDNNFFAQVFSVNETTKEFEKLQIIDFGEFSTPEDDYSQSKHVYFIGKIVEDMQLGNQISADLPFEDIFPSLKSRSQTFFNIFTVVLE